MSYAYITTTKLVSSTGTNVSGSVSSTAGNALFGTASIGGQNNANVITFSGGGTWATDVSVTNNANFLNAAIASCPNATGGSQTITVTQTGAGSGVVACFHEFSGNPTTSILDATGTNATGASAAATTNTLTNITADAVFIAMCADSGSSGTATMTGGVAPTVGSWTYPVSGKDTDGVNHQICGSGYSIVTGIISNNVSAWTIDSTNWCALIACYAPSNTPTVPNMNGFQDKGYRPGPFKPGNAF